MNWLQAMQQAPEKHQTMPPAEGGPVNAAETWQNAISGKGPQFTGLQDNVTAAASWRVAVEASAATVTKIL